MADKTGTLTMGQPQITDVVLLIDISRADALSLAASAERYSEHPLLAAVAQSLPDIGIMGNSARLSRK